jgi:hypothetical protein
MLDFFLAIAASFLRDLLGWSGGGPELAGPWMAPPELVGGDRAAYERGGSREEESSSHDR